MAIQVAGTLLVDLDATHPTAGTAAWTNTGTLGGSFTGFNGPTTGGIPGHASVNFSGASQYYQGPTAPASITGSSDRSIEVWVYNTAIPAEETMVALGHRGGPNGSNLSFNYGNNGTFGAVGHWGTPDLGWGSNGQNTPSANSWHHLVYTYDGASLARVYIDGQLANQENVGLLGTHAIDNILIAAQDQDGGAGVNPTVFGSLSIGKVRIHDGALTPANVLNNYNDEAASYGKAPIVLPGVPAPIHQYTFNDGTAADSIGAANGKILTVGNPAPATIANGQFNFNNSGTDAGNGNYIDLPIDNDFNGLTNATFEAWFTWGGGNTWQRLFDFGDSTNAWLFVSPQAGYGNNQPEFSLKNFGGDIHISDGQAFVGSALVGREAHIVGVIDQTNNSFSFYIDGARVAFGNSLAGWSFAAALGATSDFNYLGRSQFGDPFLSGQLNEFSMYNTALTGQQVLSRYFAGPVPFTAPAAVNPIHLYTFNNSTVEDAIGGRDGVGANGPTYNGSTAALNNDGFNNNAATGRYLTLPIGTTINSLTASASFEMWVNYGGGNIWQRTWDFGNDTNSYLFQTPLSGDGGNPSIFEYKQGGLVQRAQNGLVPPPLGTGVLSHIVGVIDSANNEARYYINGVLRGRDTDLQGFEAGDLGVSVRNWLGRSQFVGDALLNGTIDQFAVYNTALTQDNVNAKFAAGPNTNARPTLAIAQLQAPEGATTIITPFSLTFTDTDNAPGQVTYTVAALPVHGTLRKSGVPLLLGGAFTQADVNGGLIDYVHDGSEFALDTARFMVTDAAGNLGRIPVVATDFAAAPGNTQLAGNAVFANGRLELTQNANSQTGTATFRKPQAGTILPGFSAAFNLQMGPGTGTPADGFSFTYGYSDPIVAYGEQGPGAFGGLVVSFDTYDNGGGEAPALDVFYNGVQIGHTLVPIGNLVTNNMVPVSIQVTPSGQITVVHNGVTYYNNLAIPGWNPQAIWQFGMGGRTGGLNQVNYVDDLSIVGTPGLATLSIGVGAVADNPTLTANVTLNMNEGDTVVIPAANLAATDSTDAAAQITYTVNSLPANGVLRNNGVPILLGGTFTQADVNANLITYEHTSGNVTSDSFDFTVADAAGHNLTDTYVTSDFSVLPANTFLNGNATLVGGVLRLTNNANGENGSVVFDRPPGAPTYQGFVATFDQLIGNGTNPPADGMSFIYGDVANNALWGEEGPGGFGGLVVRSDIYDNGGGEAPAVELVYNGAVLGQWKPGLGVLNANLLLPVSIEVTPAGQATLVAGGIVIFDHVTIPGWAPQPTWKFGLGARTGGLNAQHLIDNLTIRGESLASRTFDFAIDNVDPTATIVGPGAQPFQTTPGTLLDFTFSGSDPGPFDNLNLTYDIDWGDGSPHETAAGAYSHAYGALGTFFVTLTVTDPDGAIGVDTFQVDVVPVIQDINGNVIVGGLDSENDRIIFSAASGGRVMVRWENSESLSGNVPKVYGPFDVPPGAKLIAFGGGGDDTITVSNLTIPVEFHGGDGNDYLAGGTVDDSLFGDAGNDRLLGGYGNDLIDGGDDNDSVDAGYGDDIVFGGSGNDTLLGGVGDDVVSGGEGTDGITGSNGRDILLGGDGKDSLSGGNDEDVLASGLTAYDSYSAANYAALQALLAEWTSGNTYATRIANLKSGGGAAAGNMLDPGSNVTNDDGYNDILKGAAGNDWFLASTAVSGANKDTTDRVSTETLN